MPYQRRGRTANVRYMGRYGAASRPRAGLLNTGVRAANTAVRIANAGIRKIKQMRNMYKTYKKKGAVAAILGAGKEGGDYTQISRHSYKSGKKQSFKALMPKLLKSGLNRVVYEFRGQKEFDNFGYYKSHQLSGAGVNFLPMYCFDLTARETVSGDTVVPFRRAFLTTGGVADGKITWQEESSLNNLGVQQILPFQTIESGYNGFVPANDKEMMNWTSVKLCLWGARNKPTIFRVVIFKILDEELDPWKFSGSLSTLHQVYWQSWVKGLCYHPQANIRNPHKNKVKILKEYSWTIQPTSSIENDIDPHAKLVNIYNRWDRVVNYRETGISAGDDSVLTTNAGTIPQTTINLDQTNSTSKIFMLVTSTAYTPAHEVFDSATDSSFDLIVRKGVTLFDNVT